MRTACQRRLMKEYESIWRAIGEQRFSRAVDTIIREGRYAFFPSQAEFRGYIPAESAGLERCAKCQDTSGWLYVPDYAARQMYGNTTAVSALRCTHQELGPITGEQSAQQYGAMMRDKRANPDAFFGETDALCMMRLFQKRKAEGKVMPTFNEVMSTIERVRQRAGYYKAVAR